MTTTRPLLFCAALLTVAATLACPTRAQGAYTTPPYTLAAQGALDVQIADTAWGANGSLACAGRETINFTAHLRAADGTAVAGYAQPNCQLAVDSAATPTQICSVIVHETGHQRGYAHSPDPRNVMYPASAPEVDCVRRYEAQTPAQAAGLWLMRHTPRHPQFVCTPKACVGAGRRVPYKAIDHHVAFAFHARPVPIWQHWHNEWMSFPTPYNGPDFEIA